MRVIGADDEQLGIMEIDEARNQAEENGLDLVEVAPNADPPVCRIMDYGQFKYQLSKRQHEAKSTRRLPTSRKSSFVPKRKITTSSSS